MKLSPPPSPPNHTAASSEESVRDCEFILLIIAPLPPDCPLAELAAVEGARLVLTATSQDLTRVPGECLSSSTSRHVMLLIRPLYLEIGYLRTDSTKQPPPPVFLPSFLPSHGDNTDT